MSNDRLSIRSPGEGKTSISVKTVKYAGLGKKGANLLPLPADVIPGSGRPLHPHLAARFAGKFSHDYRLDPARKMIEVARPAGVIFALTPSTNPVCTVFYKVLLALLSRNAIVISPHPKAKACCTDAALTMARAAEERRPRAVAIKP